MPDSRRRIDMITLDTALQDFEATEANLAKLDNLWKQIEKLLPQGPEFGSLPEYDELCWAFRRILPSLPAVDGFRIEDHLLDYDAIGQTWLDYMEIGEGDPKITMLNILYEQERQLREFRFRLQAKRRQLIRDRLVNLLDQIDQVLGELNSKSVNTEINTTITEPALYRLKEAVAEIDLLLGAADRPTKWDDLQRHLDSGLLDNSAGIVQNVWPAVSKSLREQIYGDYDPVPIVAEDLDEIAAGDPKGPVTSKLDWSILDAEGFERLVFSLISDEPSYENLQWLQETHAPDRGRDMSADRVDSSSLGDGRRYRTIIQCKRWLSRSVGPDEISKTMQNMVLWEPPRVDELVIATTGRFTADAIEFYERHNQSNSALYLRLWSNSHLERMLAVRPHLIGHFRLRRTS